MIDDDDFFDILANPSYLDALQEIGYLMKEVDRMDDLSLINELIEINSEIDNDKLKDLLYEYNLFAMEADIRNYKLEKEDRDYLKNLYVLFYVRIGLDDDGNFTFEP